jgi:hypothetical protein
MTYVVGALLIVVAILAATVVARTGRFKELNFNGPALGATIRW